MNTMATASMPSARAARARLAARRVERPLHRAVGAHALVRPRRRAVQHLRLDDVLGENLRPRLVADLAARRGTLA